MCQVPLLSSFVSLSSLAMAQAQLNSGVCSQAPPRQFFISLAEDLTLKVRRKSGQMVVLFYHGSKKSFSLPLDLFNEVVKANEVVTLASQLIRGDIGYEQHGYINSSPDRFHNAEHSEQF